MNLFKWTIGMAVIALGASPVLAQSAIQTAFNYELTGYSCADDPSCCCEEPSCGCEEPSCGCDDECCGDGCCGDDCCDACGDGCCDACGDGCGSSCGGLDFSTPGCCCLGDAFTLSEAILGDDAPFTMGGWIGFLYNSDNVRLSNDDNDGLSFGDNPNNLNLSQANMFFERVADGSCGLDWGFRFDALYGVDAQQTQSFGNDSATWDASNGFDNGIYGWALPQAYIELASGDWSVIAGKFYTLIGYEVVTDPDNFFATNALTMFNSEPFTHTGVLSTYNGFDNFTVYAGWTLGWDTGFDQANGGSSWLGGFSTQLTDDVAFTYISTWGNFGDRSAAGAGTQGNGYSHSLVFDVAMSDNLNYVLQSDLVAISDLDGNVSANDQVGINQYLFYTINDCFAVGSRFEWWKSDGVSFQEITLGMNYRPHANLVIRPEVRFDWTQSDTGAAALIDPADGTPFVDADDYNNTTFNVDAIMTF